MRLQLNRVFESLVLIRIGQDLGADTPAARVVHDLLELLASVPLSFFRG
jgi:hypothetical protein